MTSYPFRYKTSIAGDSDAPYMLKKSLYEFDSPKTGETYMVWVEEYEHDFYAIKFHLRRDKNNKNKYSVMTNLHEALPVLNTCMEIMALIAKKNELSSFGFIGANMAGESVENTKRYRIYSRLAATYVSEELFEHHINVRKSAYILVRKKTLEKDPDLIDVVNRKFIEMYPSLQ